ncbi:MAG: imidazolonepropionase [Chitinophagales bacterium]
MSSTLITNIKQLLMVYPENPGVVKGKAMAEMPMLENAWLLVEHGKIAAYGNMVTVPADADGMIDAHGGLVLPAFCDSHTHIVYAASREQEFLMRLQGKTYTEIAEAGGGILNSAKQMQTASEEQLFDDAMARLEEVGRSGTGAIEIKSGYGLTFASEMKMLCVIRKLKEHARQDIKATFLGAHAMPAEYANDRQGYIRIITDEMLPHIAQEGLADYCDVFCEKGYFTHEETDTILQAAAKYGLKPKIHVNQFSNSGGVQTGVRNHALSVDHLEYIGEEEINSLLSSNTLPVALPGCSMFINIPFTPGRMLIDAGLPLVVASDYNPGSAPSGNMHLMLSLACSQMHLTPAEAIHATTINGAAAMELENSLGTITVGKKAKLIITKPLDNYMLLPYYFGSDLIARTI